MPIYEFYCSKCHMIFNFYSKSVNTAKRPLCPRCKKVKLGRRMSVFASPRHRGDEEEMSLPDLDDQQMQKAMGLLAREAEGMNEEDPRQAANLMRKLTEMTGMNLGPGMEEALRRMEAGEDPEKIEAEMGHVLEDEGELFALKKGALRPSKYRLPPKVDDKLYDL
jgi:putative FmdB family regulatory protein